MAKKISNIEIKTSQDIMSDTLAGLSDNHRLIQENNELKERVKHLEDLLLNSRQLADPNQKSPEEEIVRVELKRMYDVHVLKNIPIVDKEDIKKLKTLIDALAVIKNGQKLPAKKEKDMSVEEALSLVKDELEQ
jgi:hypothetical protein